MIKWALERVLLLLCQKHDMQRKKIRLDFVVAGTQKAGTTFIHHCLMDHPDIYMPDGEIPIFSNTSYQDIEYYNSIVSELETKKRKILGIKRPSYISRPYVPQRIKRHAPSAKIIFCLRNPVDRAISAYFHNMKMMLNPYMEPNKGLLHLVKYKKFKKYPRSKWLLEYGLYYKNIKRFYKYFPKKQILIIFYEDLKNRPKETIKKIYKFLNLNSDFIPKAITTTPMKGTYSMSEILFYRLRSYFTYEKIDKRNPYIIPKKTTNLDRFMLSIIEVIEKLYRRINKNNNTVTIEDVTRETVYNFYKEDLKNLENLLKKDLSNWRLH